MPQTPPASTRALPATPRRSRRARTLAICGLATALVATACGSADATDVESDILRIAAADASGTNGLDPLAASAGASQMVVRHLYDSLMVLEEGEYRLELAESVEPNEDASEWTVTIRADAVFHNGAPVTADDVAFSIGALAAPPSNRASVYANVDFENIEVVDEHTLTIPLHRAGADFRESTLVVYSPVFPAGTTDFSEGIGSGPYRLDGHDDQTIRLAAVEDHWRGAPTVATLEITIIPDATARLNALKDQQIDYAVGISATGAQTITDNDEITLLNGGLETAFALSFAMNQQLEPFDDPRVREAVRLAADRQALVDTALLGFGEPAADVVGGGLPGYSEAISARSQDLQTARDLFESAGVTELTLRTGEILPGMMSAAQLFKQQLAEAGVELVLDETPADTYYAELEQLSTHPFQAFYYANRPAAVHLAAVTVETAPFNVTGTTSQYWTELAEAQTIVDDEERSTAFTRLQDDFYESGGDLLWGYAYQIDASHPRVGNITISQGVPWFGAASLG